MKLRNTRSARAPVAPMEPTRPCPLCGTPMTRIARTTTDRVLSLVLKAHRFRCTHFSCQWEGMLRPSKAPAAASRRGI